MVPGVPLGHTGWSEGDEQLPPLEVGEPRETTLLPQIRLLSPLPAGCPDSVLELHPLAKSGPYQDGSLSSISMEGEHGTQSPGEGYGGSARQACRGARREAALTAHGGPGSQQCPDSTLGPGGFPGLYLTRSQLPHQGIRVFSRQAAQNNSILGPEGG